MSAPAASTASTSSPRRAKSAERMEGAILKSACVEPLKFCINHPMTVIQRLKCPHCTEKNPAGSKLRSNESGLPKADPINGPDTLHCVRDSFPTHRASRMISAWQLPSLACAALAQEPESGPDEHLPEAAETIAHPPEPPQPTRSQE